MLTSPNPAQRKRALSELVQRVQAEASLTDTFCAEHLGIPRQVYALKKSGERSFNGQELVALFVIMPPLLVEVARPLGHRVVPITEQATRAEVVHAATGAIRRVSEASAFAMDALADGRVDRRECVELCEKIGDGRQALADLEASAVAAAVA